MNPSSSAVNKQQNAPAMGRVAANVEYVWAAARLVLGSIFLWAFFDKLLGLGYSTPAARAWVNGGSPTMGFLSNTKGWFAPFFQGIAGNPVTDVLFMAALLGIGAALVLGIGMRVAAASGAALMIMMYLAATPGVAGTTNPIVDNHLVFALVLVGLAMSNAGSVLGFGGAWSSLEVVKKHPLLR